MIALPSTFLRKLCLQSLSAQDEALFYGLPDKWQDYVLNYFEIFNALAAAPHVKSACLELAERNAHLGRGYSAKTIARLWRAYRKARVWTVLLKDYKAPKEPLPREFIEELKRRCEDNQRVSSTAIKSIRRDFARGVSIKGYGTWREHWQRVHRGEPAPDFWPDDFYPTGWHPRNLARHCPSGAELGLARDGYHASHHALPQIERTTAGLRALQGVVFDDVRTDWLVIVPGYPEPAELWLLVGMDIASRYIVAWAAKAIVKGEDGKKQHILRSEMRQLAASVLRSPGLPEGYEVRFVVENATATLSEAEKATLRQITGDQLAVTNSGMTHRTALPGGYEETSGQPWFKAPLESFFNLFHNELAALPGQTGASYALAPGDLDERKRAAKALLKAAAEADLPASVIAQLKAPFLQYHEAIDALTAIFRLLNERVEHDLEGFGQVAEFRFTPAENYRPIAELGRYPREQIRRAMIRHRRQSPLERWQQLTAAERFQPVSELALLPFLARTIADVAVFKPFHVRIGKVVYRADHERLRHERRESFTARILESDPSQAHLFAADGRHVCVVRCIEKVGWFDEAAMQRAFGEQKHYQALIEQPLRARHADKQPAREQAAAHNEALIAAHRNGQAMVEAAAEASTETRRQSAADRRRNQKRAAQLTAQAQRQLTSEL